VRSKKTKVEKQVAYQKIQGRLRVMDMGSIDRYYDVKTLVDYDYVLPEEQRKMVEDVKELSLKYGFNIEVVDLEKMNVLSRFEFERSKKIKTLPSMFIDSEEIFQGVMTKKQIETCFSQTAQEK
jgi:hypothetical protein